MDGQQRPPRTSPSPLEASSPRRQQIEEHLANAHQSGAGAAQIAAHRTREAKRTGSQEEMQDRHRQMAQAFGDQPARVVQAARERASRIEHEPPRVTAHEALRFAKERNLEREAVVDERVLMRDALRRSMGDVTLGAIKTEFEQGVAAGEFVGVAQPPGAPGRAFTTHEMIDLERDTITMMGAGQQAHPSLVGGATRYDIEQAYPHLSEPQRVAVQRILASRDQVQALEGVAGAGKTTALVAVRDGAEREGYRVEGLAPTSRAAQKLGDTGITSKHIAAASGAA